MNTIDDLCMWKDLYYQYKSKGLSKGISTFYGYESWDKSRDLCKCIGCSGYDDICRGYKSLKDISRKKHR